MPKKIEIEITELRSKPKIPEKVYKPKSLGQKIVEAFLKKNIKYGQVKVPEGKSVNGVARGIGRFLKGHTEYKVNLLGSDKEKGVVYLEAK